MKLMISTQIQENYGAFDWDGTGECPQHWKCKSGEDYWISVDAVKAINTLNCMQYINVLRPSIERDNNYIRENVIRWSVESDDYMTIFERDQMEYAGHITYPAVDLNETFIHLSSR